MPDVGMTIKEALLFIGDLMERAYGWHINNRVLGFDIGEFEGKCEELIRIIKAQEPRVMTLDELSEKTDVYFESLVYDTIVPALTSGSYDDGTVGLMTLEEGSFYMDEADYGVKWRCWTDCPTDAQREAEPREG